MRNLNCILCALVAISAVATPQSVKSVPADKKAFAAAASVSDSQERISSLKRFIVEYPKSSRISRANSLILVTLVKYFPNQTVEINRQVNVMLKNAKGEFRMFDYDDVASTLSGGSVLLPRAEQISKKSLKMFRQKEYVANIRAAYAKAKIKQPSDADLVRFFQTRHSLLEATLGIIYVKEGKTGNAEPLLKAAYSEDPDNSEAAANLGMLAAKAGRTDEALTYLVRGQLTGKLEESEQQQLEELYAVRHPASSSFEEYIDKQYELLFPQPFEATKYQRAGNPSGRIVLAELFTGSGCDPCAGADLAIDADLERYSRDDLAVLAFDEHIPEPDPLANPASVKRFQFYDGQGTPTLAIDGTTELVGADREGAKQRFEENNKLIEKALQSKAEAHIQLTASRHESQVRVHASVDGVNSDAKTLKLQIALVEDRLRYSGENGIRFHPMVVRGMAGEDGFEVGRGKDCAVDYVFDIQQISGGLKAYLDAYEKSNDRFGPITFIQKMDKINPNGLSVVAFVQDTETKHVLQAAYARVENAQ